MNRDSTHTETKPGYKKTKFGMIPEGWELKKLSNVIKLESGQHLSPDEYNNEKEGLPYFTGPTDFCSSLDEVTKWTEDGKKYADKGDILITVKGSGVGSLYISDLDKVAIGRQLMAIKPKKINQGYLYNFLLQRNKVFEILASGNMIPGLSRDDILSFKIPCPPEEQQEKISEIFSIWDEAISKTEKLIQAKKRYKKGLMQRLLSGKVRFPEFEGEEWVEVKLGDITTEKRIKGKSVELNTENRGMPYIGSTSFKGDFTQYTDDPKAVIAKKRDLLLLWDGEYAGKITTNLEGAASSTVAVIKLKSNVNNMYLKLLMEYENGKIRAITEGSGIPHIPKDFIKWYKVKLPSIEEQSKIVDLIAGVESEVSLLTHKADLFKKQKKGLMQQLLTGKLRVNLN